MNRSQIDALTRNDAASRSRREFVGLIPDGTLGVGMATRPTPTSAEKRRGSRKGHGGYGAHGGHGGHGGCVPTEPT